MRVRSLLLDAVLAATVGSLGFAQGPVQVGGVTPASVPSPRVPPLHVDHRAAPGGDGASWQTAFDDLQDALAVAVAGDEIWVAEGEYVPSTTDAAVSFAVPSNVALYGGFAGHEVSRAQRDWTAHPTILSGDVGGDDVIGPSWPNGWDIVTPNSAHVLDLSGCGPGTVVDGFTIEKGATGPHGTPASSAPRFGGGVFVVGGSPTIRNCVLTHNSASFGHGAAIYVNDGDVLVDSCTVVENLTHSGGGGGMTAVGFGRVTVVDSTFARNEVIATQVSLGSGDGAGIFSMISDGLVLERCTFDRNRALAFWPVGDELGYGGGVFAWTRVDALHCRFVRNEAHFGGGLMCWDSATVIDCDLFDNVAHVQPNDPFPERGGYGAGIAIQSVAAKELLLHGSTVAFNRGKKYVGLVTMASGASARVENSILWGNAATHPEVVGYSRSQIDGDYFATYSCIEHLFDGPAAGEDIPDPSDVPGCIDDDPLFVAPPLDRRLGFGSPCVDAARNSFVPPFVTVDLGGLPRFVDDPAVPNTGVGSGPIVDMGAHERQ